MKSCTEKGVWKRTKGLELNFTANVDFERLEEFLYWKLKDAMVSDFIETLVYFSFRCRLRQNYELLKHKKEGAAGILMTLEREVANKMEETRALTKQMNSIKPDIMKLQRSKQQYYL